jgi:hypothetical protein
LCGVGSMMRLVAGGSLWLIHSTIEELRPWWERAWFPQAGSPAQQGFSQQNMLSFKGHSVPTHALGTLHKMLTNEGGGGWWWVVGEGRGGQAGSVWQTPRVQWEALE